MAFSGKATYDDFNSIHEDLSDVITVISPKETPLLDLLPEPDRAARNILYEWLEDEYSPNTLTLTVALTTGATELALDTAGVGLYIQAGALLKLNDEYMLVTTTTANTLVVTRGVGGTTATSAAVGGTVKVVADAALEGADVSVDTSRDRTRKNNYVQIFKKDVIVSGTQRAVANAGVSDEFEFQKGKKLIEAMRDLEKALIMGISLGNTIGTASARRTSAGLLASITTNVNTIASGATLTESCLNSVIGSAWEAGADDLDLIVCSKEYKDIIDSWQGTRIRVDGDETKYQKLVTTYESNYGIMRVLLDRWMPANHLVTISTNRVRVVPLIGRTFQFIEVAQTGDSSKGMVIGEYTFEVRGEKGMVKIRS